MFETTWRTGSRSVRNSLLKALAEVTDEYLYTDEIVSKIKSFEDFDRKIEIWNKLKVTCLTKITVFMISSSFIEVLLRCQLSILTGNYIIMLIDKHKIFLHLFHTKSFAFKVIPIDDH